MTQPNEPGNTRTEDEDAFRREFEPATPETPRVVVVNEVKEDTYHPGGHFSEIRDQVLDALNRFGPLTAGQVRERLPNLTKDQVYGSLYNSTRTGTFQKSGELYSLADRGKAILRGDSVPPAAKGYRNVPPTKSLKKHNAARNANLVKAREARALKTATRQSNSRMTEDLGTLFEAVGLDNTGEMVVRSIESKKLYRLSIV